MSRRADTQIRITQETWEQLNQRKGPGDAFEDVISELLDEVDDNGEADDIGGLIEGATEAQSDDAADETIAELPEVPEVGDEIDHPTMGRVRVVGFADGQIEVEEVDGQSDVGVFEIADGPDDVRHPGEG